VDACLAADRLEAERGWLTFIHLQAWTLEADKAFLKITSNFEL